MQGPSLVCVISFGDRRGDRRQPPHPTPPARFAPEAVPAGLAMEAITQLVVHGTLLACAVVSASVAWKAGDWVSTVNARPASSHVAPLVQGPGGGAKLTVLGLRVVSPLPLHLLPPLDAQTWKAARGVVTPVAKASLVLFLYAVGLLAVHRVVLGRSAWRFTDAHYVDSMQGDVQQLVSAPRDMMRHCAGSCVIHSNKAVLMGWFVACV